MCWRVSRVLREEGRQMRIVASSEPVRRWVESLFDQARARMADLWPVRWVWGVVGTGGGWAMVTGLSRDGGG